MSDIYWIKKPVLFVDTTDVPYLSSRFQEKRRDGNQMRIPRDFISALSEVTSYLGKPPSLSYYLQGIPAREI